MKHILDYFSFDQRKATSAGRSLAELGHKALVITGTVLLSLSLLVMISSAVNHVGLSRLVDKRLVPISDLERVLSGYEQSLSIASKVRTGNLTRLGGASALRSLQNEISRSWTVLDAIAPVQAGGMRWSVIQQERGRADAALGQMTKIIASGDKDRLEFFLSGSLLPQVDPMLTAARNYSDGLRIQAERDRAIFQTVAATAQGLVIVFLLLSLLIGQRVIRFAEKRVLGPLTDITREIAASQDGSTVQISHRDRTDEIGDIARAISLSAQRSAEASQLASEKLAVEATLADQKQQVAERAEQRGRQLQTVMNKFGEEIAELVAKLAATSQSMRAFSRGMTQSSDEAETIVNTAARSVCTIADSMKQIAESRVTFAKAAEAVEHVVGSTRSQAAEMHVRSQEFRSRAIELRSLVEDIFGALELISHVAKQTNMLALNATIEASRAGSSGRGFAVVAQEVKNLAAETQNAALTIEAQLSRIASTSDLVLASASDAEMIAAGFDQNADDIAEAVAVQTESSRRMAIALERAYEPSDAAAAHMANVSERMRDLLNTARELELTADQIATQAGGLNSECGALKDAVLRVA